MSLIARIRDLSLKKKLLFLFAVIGLAPLFATFFVSYGELRKSVVSNQSYAANQGFEQTLTALSNKFSQIEKISSMIIINKEINALLSRNPDAMPIPEQIASFDSITAYTSILETNLEFSRIVYYIDDRFAITGDKALYRPLGSVKDEAWASKIYSHAEGPTWVLYEESAVFEPKRYLSVGRVLWNARDLSIPVGFVAINVDLRQIRDSLPKSAPEQLVYLETEEGEIVASSDESEWAGMRLPGPLAGEGTFQEVKLAGGDYLARSSRIGDTNLFLNSVISQRATAAAVNKVRNQMLTVYSVISLALLLLIFPVTKSVTHRILLLMNKMSQVRQGRLNTLDIAPSNDEVGKLVLSYNYMINSLHDLLREQFKLGKERKGAELKALQSQINPHFLYNTLDMLIWMVQKQESDNVRQVIYALSDYYKLVLNKGEDFVPVSDELRLCSIYVAIQQKRYRGKIKFEIDVESELLDCLVPKITLQPLVENAIVHGIMEKPERSGMIRIAGRVQDQRMVLTVEDDGAGVREKSGSRSGNQGSGYGVSNISKRLELFFGGTGGIDMASEAGRGVSVTIDVPMVKRQ